MNNSRNILVQSLNRKLGLFAGIAFGVFLFILFFQPFPLDKFDFNNKLLFVAGFGAIVFFFMFLIKIIFPRIIHRKNSNNHDSILNSYGSDFFILALCSVAFAFYLRYVGSVSISFFVVFRITLICLVSTVILRLFDVFQGLLQQNESLISERKTIQKQIEKFEEDNLNKSIEFISESNGENLTLLIAEVIFIQAADNYVEIAYKEGEYSRKKLIRNTLKNIELQIKQYSNFIRCHRAFIVNMHYIEKLNRDFSSHWITIKGYEGKIPVSRQYLLKLREAL